jgi:TPR repeat protein
MLERFFEKKDTAQYNNSEEDMDLDLAVALDEDIALNLSSIESDGDPLSQEIAEEEAEVDEYAAASEIEEPDEPKSCEEICRETVELALSGQLDADQAIVTLESFAMGELPEAWIYLGQLCSECAAAYDPAEAFKCFETAANLEIPEGYYRLGLCYSDGFGCEKDEKRAVDCFLSGAENDHVGCIRTLGICRELGIGCPIDYEMAVALYTKAAMLGDAIAANNLGGCYYYGHGVAQSKEKAVDLYERASTLGNANASCRLGICY